VRISFRRGMALTAVAALTLAACGDQDNGDDPTAQEDGQLDGEDLDEGDLEDLLGDDEELEDPNENIEDGVYRGSGVVLPIPDGWQIDPGAFQQGAILALADDQSQQLSARAIDAEEAEAAGQPMDLDTLLDMIREDVGEDADVDEEIELEGAATAHRLTYLDLPSQQEGAPDSSVTILIAEDGNGNVGEFTYAAEPDNYDEDIADLLATDAGFDPDSEPPAMPQAPQPAPEGEGGEMSPEEMEEMFEDQD
jgi:hypothetical protein